MEIRPIRTEEDHKAALAEIDRLWNAEPGTPEEDRLDILATLVAAWEEQHHPIPPPDPIEAIRYYMESRGLSPGELEDAIGSRARAAEVLSRKRPLTLRMIRRLHVRLGIPTDVLIQPYALEKQPASQAA